MFDCELTEAGFHMDDLQRGITNFQSCTFKVFLYTCKLHELNMTVDHINIIVAVIVLHTHGLCFLSVGIENGKLELRSDLTLVTSK